MYVAYNFFIDILINVRVYVVTIAISPQNSITMKGPTHSRPHSITFYFIAQFLWLHAATVMLALHTPFKLYSQSFR